MGGLGDPLFNNGLDVGGFVILLVRVLVGFGALLISVVLMIWFERKVISDMQNRIGPNRAGPFGLLQTFADGTKLIFKEDLLPERADRFVYKLAPFLAVLPAFAIFTVVPIGGVVDLAHHVVELQIADPPIGILLVLAFSSIAVYGVMLAGWSSGSKYPLLGSVRASAQMISYEAAMGLAVVTVILESHGLSTRAIVESQATAWYHWNVLRLGVVPAAMFFIAMTAELNRPPFDLAEGESELGGGFHTEYSAFRFATFYLAEFMNTVTFSAIMVTLFFGGPDGPGFHIPHVYWLFPILWFIGKTVVFCYIQVWIRAALPRLRYDQLMDLGWKWLIPLSLAWMLVVAGALEGVAWMFGVIGGCLLLALVLWRAAVVSKQRRIDRGEGLPLGRPFLLPPVPPQPPGPPAAGRPLEHLAAGAQARAAGAAELRRVESPGKVGG
ncbi:MAG TPA: complex I subunit 1 family protein [Acidimicrobiales bacterium]|nr:complex I subunit 1 family protein [Acidimicrobiales bacterium]